MIEVKDIKKSYGKNEVLHGISFILQKGEITAFLGANGAGKTTTMNILAGIIPATSGNILIDGVNMEDNPVQLKKRIGYLPEDNPLYQNMYVREYLEYVARIYLAKAEIKEKVQETIEKVGLTAEYKKKIGALSHGNKQRVGLGQAIIHDPEILILDEPATGLDPTQQMKLNNLIKEWGQSKIILFSSHRLDDVSDIASRYLVIKDGNLILDEKADQIESIKEYFYQIYQ